MSRISPLYDNIRLNCTIVSDTHIDIEHPMPWFPKMKLKKALKDSKSSTEPVDAFIVVGDTTSHGSDINWKMTKECFDKVPGAAKKNLLTVGNHDGWNDDGYDAAEKNYFKYFELICGDKIKKPYFSYKINGISLIFLGNESASGCEAFISDEQLEWFENEMNAAEADKPVFVFCHQSLNQKHGLPRTWSAKEDPDADPMEGGIGITSEKVEAIMKIHKNVYYFSGHSHMGLCGENTLKAEGYSSFESEGGLTLINLPSLACGNHHGETPKNGIGVQLEVYDDKVVIRPRKFRGGWNKKIVIKDGKPYFEAKIK